MTVPPNRDLRDAAARVLGSQVPPAEALRLAGEAVATLFSPDELWALLACLDELGAAPAGIGRIANGWVIVDAHREVFGTTIGEVLAEWRRER